MSKKQIIGVLPIPVRVGDDGRQEFDIDGGASNVDLEADFRLADRELQAIKDEHGVDVPAELVERIKLLQDYKRALATAARAKLAASAALAENIEFPTDTPDAPAPATQVEPAAETELSPSDREALDGFRVEGDVIVDRQGNQYRRVGGEVNVTAAANAITADQVAAMAAAVRPDDRPVHPVLAVEPSADEIARRMASEAPLVAALGAFSAGQDRAGDVVSPDQAAHLLHSMATRQSNGKATTYLYRRDRFAPLAASLGLQRLQGNRAVDGDVVAAQAQHRDALLAAFCGPAELNRDQRVIANTNRPIAQALAQVNPPIAIGTGAHEFFRAIGLADLYAHYDAYPSAAPGLGVWTSADQAAIDRDDSSTWKGVFTLPNCPSTVTVSAYFLWRALRVSVEDQMSRPQYVANMTTLMEAMLARTAEGALLATFDAWSFQRTMPSLGYGAMMQLFEGVNRALAWATSTARINRTDYDLIVPEGMLTAAKLDAVYAGENPADVEARLLEQVGGRLVVTPDWGAEGNPMLPMPVQPDPDTPNADNGDPLPALPNVWTVRLLPLADFAWGATGVADYGLETSPDLRLQNSAMYFGETAELCYKNGGRPSFTVTFEDMVANGARAQKVTPFGVPSPPVDGDNTLSNMVPAGLAASHFYSASSTIVS